MIKLKDYLETAQGCYCLVLDDIGFKSKTFARWDVNKTSKILNCKVINFWSVAMEGEIVQCVKIECKNLNSIKDFFEKK